MGRKWLWTTLAVLLVAMLAGTAFASGEPEGGGGSGGASGTPVELQILDGSDLYVGPELGYESRGSWFDYQVSIPREPSLPIVAREIGIKSSFAFFDPKPTKTNAGGTVNAVAIMNLDVFGKLQVGYSTHGGQEIFDDPVIVNLSEDFLKARTGFAAVRAVYFFYEGLAYTPQEFADLKKIADLDVSDGLSFRILSWPVDDLMLIGEGR